MLPLEEIESGAKITHRNTGLRYSVVDLGEEEVLLSPEQPGLEDLVVPVELFRKEFLSTDRYNPGRKSSGRRGRGRRASFQRTVSGPKAKGRIKKMVHDRGFGFIRGDDGKEVFFHRSGMTGGDYDALAEGSVVEYVIQEGPRGPRAENVRAVPPGSIETETAAT